MDITIAVCQYTGISSQPKLHPTSGYTTVLRYPAWSERKLNKPSHRWYAFVKHEQHVIAGRRDHFVRRRLEGKLRFLNSQNSQLDMPLSHIVVVRYRTR